MYELKNVSNLKLNYSTQQRKRERARLLIGELVRM